MVRALGRPVYQGSDSPKIQEVEALSRIADMLRGQGKRIVLCHGVFDVIHPGHVRHLHKAKEYGDVLIVSVTADQFVRKGIGQPVFNQVMRAETLAAIELVDYVCVVSDYTAAECIKALRPHLYSKGSAYRDVDEDPTGAIVVEQEAVRAIGGEVLFTEDCGDFSSTSLINEYGGILTKDQRAFLRDIQSKYISSKHIIRLLNSLADLKVLILGDTIIDEYVYCEPLGQSLKQSLVSHQYLREERFCGGTIAVANQVAEFCGEVTVATVLGGLNSFEGYIRSNLRQNVSMHAFTRHDAPTVVKRRYLYEDVERKVFEVSYVREAAVPGKLEADVAEFVREQASGYDLVMVTDYGHGALTQRIAAEATLHAKFLAVNAQTNSANMGYNLITKKYSGLDYACVDEAEARLAVQDKHEDIETLGPKLMHRLNAEKLMITCGRNGARAFERGGGTWSAPAFATQVVDRVGAGDAFFSVTAPCMAVGMPMDLTSFVGNAVGALAVGIVGNREPVAAPSLRGLIASLVR